MKGRNVKVEKTRNGHIIYIEAKGDTLEDAVIEGLSQACNAVDKIADLLAEGETGTEKVIDITLICPNAAGMRQAILSYWEQAEPNLAGFFPLTSLVFWSVVAKLETPPAEVTRKLEDYFTRIETLISGGEQIPCSIAYSLGEFEAMILASANRKYIPFYTRLLRCWDMTHESHQHYQTIGDLARGQGPCPEVDDLITTRLVEAPGLHGFDQFKELYPFICEWYGDLLASPVFAAAREKMRTLGYDPDGDALREVFAGEWDE